MGGMRGFGCDNRCLNSVARGRPLWSQRPFSDSILPSFFNPLLSRPHLILLNAEEEPSFLVGNLTQANSDTPEPVTRALFQSHIIMNQCHATHTFQEKQRALWSTSGKSCSEKSSHSECRRLTGGLKQWLSQKKKQVYILT